MTLDHHFTTFLHTYIPTRSKKGEVLEDNLDCPLVELELIHKVGERASTNSMRHEAIYAFRVEEKPEISAELFAYCLADFWEQRFSQEKTLPFRQIVVGEGSPARCSNSPNRRCESAWKPSNAIQKDYSRTRNRPRFNKWSGNGNRTSTIFWTKSIPHTTATRDMKIAGLFNIQSRFLRSANLERDFRDPAALQGYVVTSHIQANLDRISGGLDRNSGQRAWRITGSYGSGKSSFALLLANVFAGKDANIPPQLRRSIDLTNIKRNKPRYLPVLITGSREAMATVVIRSIGDVLENLPERRSRRGILDRIKQYLGSAPSPVADSDAARLVLDANSEVIASHAAEGLLIIMDELGKFLEFAALHPERQDVYFLQQLAETSTRSSKEPLFIVGLLHQGISAYADHLSQSGQKEWEKIVGRFEEVVFDQPLDQVVHLVNGALSIPRGEYPRGLDTRAKAAMHQALDLGWYGTAPPTTSLTQSAAGIYPLHPTVIPILVRLFARFGQNERSLFSFLLSNEPFGLQTFAQLPASVDTFYRINDLYDYAASNFGHRLSVQSYRNHWNHIDSLVRSFRSSSDAEIAVLKTVGLLNLINSPELVPSEESLVLALSDGTKSSTDSIRTALLRLHKHSSILYSRGRMGGYCLWSHTSVNLDAAYEGASRVVGHSRRVASRIKDRLDTRPIVARRHYITTGNLRHFEVAYCNLGELESLIKTPLNEADGRIVIPLCETVEEMQAAKGFACSVKGSPELLIGLTEPLNDLEKLVHEVERWSWVQKNTPELKDDHYASEEVTRQLASATQTLEKRVQHYAGLRQVSGSGAASMKWFHNGKEQRVESGKAFLALLSDLCDNLYPNAPSVQNELINRRSLSSAAASARMRLVKGMFDSSDKPLLGMDPAKKPPEMSMYLSVLLASKLHALATDGTWTLQEPSAGDDPCHLRPGISRLMQVLESNPDSRLSVAHVFETLRQPPYGIRNGILPILLVVVILQHQHEIALYENGTFLSHVDREEILRLSKAPQTFELQFCKVQGIRRALFDKLIGMLGVSAKAKSKGEVLDIVRPLCVFIAELPEYTRITSRLSLDARAVRDAILRAREPGILLFRELPLALDLEPFASEHDSELSLERIQEFVIKLKAALDELRMVYPLLKDRIREKLADAFDVGKSSASFQALRDSLSERCEGLVINIRDIDLKAFCLRLIDSHLPESDWLESVGSYVATTPPLRWKDDDENIFDEKLKPLVQKLMRVESLNFPPGKKESSGTAIRVAITARDGSERDKVVHLNSDEEQEAKQTEAAIGSILKANERISIIAMSRVIWKIMEKTNERAN